MLLVALAGLGLLQGGHCNDMSVTATSPASAVSQDGTLPVSVGVGSGSAVTASPGLRHDQAGLPHPATTVEDCEPLMGTVATSAGVTAAPVPLVLRTSMIRARPMMSVGRVLPGVALTAIGVLRT